MVRQFFDKIAAPIRGLHEAAYVLAGLTLVAQLLALLRDRILAHQFGAGELLDIYYAAFKVPDVVFALVASLVSAYVLIPRIARISREETRELISQATSFLVIGGGIACFVLALFAPYLLFHLFPTFKDSIHAAEFVMLARLLLLQPILLGVSGIFMSVTQLHRRFALYALSPVLYNVGIIVGAVFLYPRYGLWGLGAGVLLGAILHLAIHIPILLNAGVFPRLSFPRWSIMSSVIRDSIPRSLALSMGSVTMLALTALAAGAGKGAVSVFTLAGNLEAVPLALIGASYATAAFPALAEHIERGAPEAFTASLVASARHIVLWSSVALVFFVVLRAHLVRAILGSGAFDWSDTRLTAAVLGILVAGLVAQALVLLMLRAAYAARQSWVPLFVQILGGLLSVCLALLLLTFMKNYPGAENAIARFFRVEGVPGFPVLFIALGATLGQVLMAFIALYSLSVKAPGLLRLLRRPLGESMFAALAGGAAAYGVLVIVGGIAPLTTLFAVLTQGLIAGIVGLAVTALVLTLLKNREWIDVVHAIRSLRVSGVHLLPPGDEDYGAHQ